MRFVVVVMGFLLVMFSGTFWLLFTQSGNNVVRPYLEEKISEKLQKKVVLNAYTLKTGYLDIEAVIDQTSKVVVSGDINFLDKRFDLMYKVDANNLQTPVVLIQDQLLLEGKAKGFLQDFILDGRGLAFKSKVRFTTHLKEGRPAEIELDAKGVQVGEMLELMGKPKYTQGVVDIVVRGKEGDNGLNGKADAKIHIGQLDEELIKRDFNIVIPPNTTYKGKIDALIEGDIVTAKSDIFTTLALLKTEETKIDLKTKSLNSDYEVLISNLTDWELIVGQKLYGSVRVTGNVKKENGVQAIDAHSQTLGGNIDVLMVDHQAQVEYKNVQIRDIFSLIGEPAIAFGAVSGKTVFDDIRENTRQGVISVRVDEGELVGEQLSALSGLKFPQVVTFNVAGDMKVDKNIATYEGKIASSLLNIPSFKGTFDTKTKHLLGTYGVYVPELGKLDFVTKRKLNGVLEAKGEIEQREEYRKVTAQTDVIDGNTTLVFENDLLHVKADGFGMKRLSTLAQVPYVFDSFGQMEATYNIASKLGAFDVSMVEGRLLQNQLTDLVIGLTGFDMTQEIYKDTLLKGTIDHDLVDYNLSMQGGNSALHVKAGTYDMKDSQMRAEFDLNIDQKDFSGVVKGDIKAPKVNIKGSEYLKQKLEKEIDKHVPENAKGILKDILKLF